MAVSLQPAVNIAVNIIDTSTLGYPFFEEGYG
jgi:hypothetical protein